jgi:hypothetical protein
MSPGRLLLKVLVNSSEGLEPEGKIQMNSKRILGFLAVAGLLIIAAPNERAMALSLINPGTVAAQEESGKLTTEVYWRHGWHRHYGWHRYYGWHRHYWHRRHW